MSMEGLVRQTQQRPSVKPTGMDIKWPVFPSIGIEDKVERLLSRHDKRMEDW